MGAQKTITSPDPTPNADVLALREEACAFIRSAQLDALEALFLSGYTRESVRLCAEEFGVPDEDVVARLNAVEVIVIEDQPKPFLPKPPRGQ